MDGFYIGYLAGRAGTSVILFVIRNSELFGVDAGAMKYEGTVKSADADTIQFQLVYVVPPGASLITGMPAPKEETRIPFEFALPTAFADGRVLRLETPTGPVNGRFEKIREL